MAYLPDVERRTDHVWVDRDGSVTSLDIDNDALARGYLAQIGREHG